MTCDESAPARGRAGCRPPLDRRIEVRERAHRAGELADPNFARAADALDVARQLGVPERQLQTEGHRLGVDAVRAADHRRVLVLAARVLTASPSAGEACRIRSHASRICSASAVSTTSEEVRPKCSQRADGQHSRPRGREGDHVVLGDLFNLIDAGDVEGAPVPQFACGLLRNDAGVGHRLGGGKLHLQPRL